MKSNRMLITILLSFIVVGYCFQGFADFPFRAKKEAPAKLLQTTLKNGEAIVWHLYHSGFAIKTAHHLLVFDYWPGKNIPKNKNGFTAGLIDANEIKEEHVLVFVSHEHHDHWYKGCLEWKEKIKKIHYFVSPEVSQGDKRFEARKGLITTLGSNKVTEIQGVRIKTLRSTDSGVAFLVKIDGLTIYHSGDHACWNWKNDPKVASQFVTELLRPLDSENIDIAMHVCDPRLRKSGWGGIIAFAKKYKPKMLAPMHLWGRYKSTQEINDVLKAEKIQVPFWPIQGRGDCIIFRSDKTKELPPERRKEKRNQ